MEHIKYDRQGFVGLITIERREVLNALSSRLLDELEAVFDSISLDEIRSVILTGAGEKSFAAGADITAMCEMSRVEARNYSLRGNRVFHRIETFPLPVIAAVNGYALGAGCDLATACDIRLASENAIFGHPEVELGVIAGFGGTYRLARLVGPAKARELLFTGVRLRAADALFIGLVNAVYPADRLMAKALEMARVIASNSPVAVRAMKRAMEKTLRSSVDEAISVESAEFANTFETPEQRDAMTAFVEKRGKAVD